MARLVFFFASLRHYDFLNCETGTSNCFKCKREAFILLKELRAMRMSLSLTKEPSVVDACSENLSTANKLKQIGTSRLPQSFKKSRL